MNDKISSPYPISPIAYFKRYRDNITHHNKTQNKSFLFYAALELRFTIESLLFHYLNALNKDGLSKNQQKLYRPQDLKKAILASDPLFLIKLEFADLCAYQAKGEISSQLRPNIDLLNEVHGKLGGWLHAEYAPLCRKVPEQQWIDLAKLFESISGHLSLILSHPLLSITLKPKGDQLIKDYAAGNITRQEVTQRLIKEWNLMFHSTTQHILLDE